MKRKKKIMIVGAIFLIILIIGISCILFFFNPFLTISLKGKKEITIEFGNPYKDPSVDAKFFGNNVQKDVKKDKVSTKKIGTYRQEYSIQKLWTKKKVTRTIKIVDTEKPDLKLKGEPTISLTIGSTYEEPGYDAIDNYDGDLNSKVTVDGTVDTAKVGEYKLVYKVKDSSNNETKIERTVTVIEKKQAPVTNSKSTGSSNNGGYNNIVMGPKYIKGILIVNKKYALPSTYGGGIDATASQALGNLQAGAQAAGFSMPLLSGYRSYQTQVNLYQRYVNRDGQALADTYSARPGHSEHQTGLAFDVGSIDNNYGNTPAGKWLVQNCAEYGFILRYQKGKESITGYQYEPWHIRYVGVTAAKEIMSKGITLEEYLGVA